MVPAPKRMVLNVEYNLTSVSVPTAVGTEVLLVGVIDYTIVVAKDQDSAGERLSYRHRLFSCSAYDRTLPKQSNFDASCPKKRVGVGVLCR